MIEKYDIRKHAMPHLTQNTVNERLEILSQLKFPGIKVWLLQLQTAVDNKIGGGTFPWYHVLKLAEGCNDFTSVSKTLNEFFAGLVPMPPLSPSVAPPKLVLGEVKQGPAQTPEPVSKPMEVSATAVPPLPAEVKEDVEEL